jgi:hypothetical protein
VIRRSQEFITEEEEEEKGGGGEGEEEETELELLFVHYERDTVNSPAACHQLQISNTGSRWNWHQHFARTNK